MGTKRLLLSIQPGFRVLLNPGCLAQNHPASFQAKPSAKGRGLRTRSFETLALMVRRPASSFETLASLAPQDEAGPRTALAPQDEGTLMLRSARKCASRSTAFGLRFASTPWNNTWHNLTHLERSRRLKLS